MYLDKMKFENYDKMMQAVFDYRSCPPDALATLKYFYSIRPNSEDTIQEKFAERMYWEVLSAVDSIRDDDGNIMLEETYESLIYDIDEVFYYLHTAGFVRTMNRMKKLKEELMAATWHPRRIERLLELGGEEALDNFAGV